MGGSSRGAGELYKAREAMQGFGADSADFGADLIVIDSKATPAGIFSPTPTPTSCKIC